MHCTTNSNKREYVSLHSTFEEKKRRNIWYNKVMICRLKGSHRFIISLPSKRFTVRVFFVRLNSKPIPTEHKIVREYVKQRAPNDSVEYMTRIPAFIRFCIKFSNAFRNDENEIRTKVLYRETVRCHRPRMVIYGRFYQLENVYKRMKRY